jgi:hypothetical protein
LKDNEEKTLNRKRRVREKEERKKSRKESDKCRATKN